MKLFILFLIMGPLTFTQTNNPLDFWPAHKGDVFQYRDGATNGVDHTVYIDSVVYDSRSKSRIVYEGGWTSNFYNHYRIDSSGNVYGRGLDSEYVRYKLPSDSGDSWIAGFTSNGDTVTVKVFRMYNSTVFWINTVVKGYRFEEHLPNPPYLISWGDDYLAKGFGLIRTESEGFLFYLSGAIINEEKYGVITSVEKETQVPKSFDIISNYPNPFNNSTIVEYKIANESNVNISVYDILGRKVKELINERKGKGNYKIRLNADELSSGIFFLVLNTNSSILTHKICLLK